MNKERLLRASTRIATAVVVAGLIFSQNTYAQTMTAQQVEQRIQNAAQKNLNRAAEGAVRDAINNTKPTSQDIAGKCVRKVMETKVTAYASGAAVAAISAMLGTNTAGFAVPSNDAGGWTAGSWQSGEGVATTILSWMEPLRQCLEHEAKQLMIDQINIAATAAIREGLGGSPNFNRNLNNFLGDIANVTSQQVRYFLNDFNVCDFTGTGSYKTQLSRSVGMAGQRPSPQQNLRRKAECPFGTNSAAKVDANKFYTDFSGGRPAWNIAIQDSGNPFGIALQLAQAQAEEKAKLQKSFEQTLLYGNGYLSVVDPSDCNYPEGLEQFINTEADAATAAILQRQYCKVVTPAKTVADTASKAATGNADRLNAPGTMDGAERAMLESTMGTMVNGMF